MVLWEMASRKTPFEAIHAIEGVKDLVLNGSMELLSSEWPATYHSIILQCWGEPQSRPTSKELVESISKGQAASQRKIKEIEYDVYISHCTTGVELARTLKDELQARQKEAPRRTLYWLQKSIVPYQSH